MDSNIIWYGKSNRCWKKHCNIIVIFSTSVIGWFHWELIYNSCVIVKYSTLLWIFRKFNTFDKVVQTMTIERIIDSDNLGKFDQTAKPPLLCTFGHFLTHIILWKDLKQGFGFGNGIPNPFGKGKSQKTWWCLWHQLHSL